MPYLEIKLGPDTMLLRFVGRIDYVFGRLPRADVQLRDMKVSRLHTQCFIDSRGNAFVRDLGSSGGTFIMNQRLRRGVIAPLTNGVKFRVGDASMTFYDQEPPVNAMEPPCQSDPRGLIRTNHRERYFEAEATVLAMNKVDPETQSGPAEPPPELNPADFADKPGDLADKPFDQKPAPLPQSKPAAKPASNVQAKPPAKPDFKKPEVRKPPTKRNTGIVEAPWEKPAPAPAKEKRVTIPPPTRGGKQPPPPMQTAEIDEMGKFHAPAAQPQPPAKPGTARPLPPRSPSPLPPRQPAPAPFFNDELDENANTSREPAVPDSGAFRPPPPITGAMPAPEEEDEEPKQRVGLPTVRLERPAILERQKQIDQEEAEERAAVRIPTASVTPTDLRRPVDETEPEPQIGVAPPNREVIAGADDASVDTGEAEDLTDDQIHEYLGASASGRFGDINYGDKPEAAEPPEPDEVRFGSAAQVGLAGDADIDLADEAPAVVGASAQETPSVEVPADEVPAGEVPADDVPAGEVPADDVPAEELSLTPPPVTAQQREAVPQPAVTAEDPVIVENAPVQESTTSMLGGTTAVQEDAVDEPDDTSGLPPGDVPSYEDHGTPPPATREGATDDKTFKPRKTRKLMKRRKDTAKITDRSNPTPLPEGAKTVHMPPPDTQLPIVPGAKTMFIPKPDDAKLSRPAEPQQERPTGKAKAVPENRERKTLAEMGEGPGGDTVAMPPGMMKQMQDELRKHKEAAPTIGDSATVKITGDEEEDEFVLDEDYAFFTPPPATRQAREAAAKLAQDEPGDVINGNDFNTETDKLPPDKKAKSKGDPDTLVD